MHQIRAKRVYDLTRPDQEGNLILIWPCEQELHAQPRICSGELDAQTSQGFWDINWSPHLSQTTRLRNRQKKKENLPKSGLYRPARPQSKIKREINM